MSGRDRSEIRGPRASKPWRKSPGFFCARPGSGRNWDSYHRPGKVDKPVSPSRSEGLRIGISAREAGMSRLQSHGKRPAMSSRNIRWFLASGNCRGSLPEPGRPEGPAHRRSGPSCPSRQPCRVSINLDAGPDPRVGRRNVREPRRSGGGQHPRRASGDGGSSRARIHQHSGPARRETASRWPPSVLAIPAVAPLTGGPALPVLSTSRPALRTARSTA